MAMRMGVGPWEVGEGDKKRRKKRDAWFCLCGCGNGWDSGSISLKLKYCVGRKSHTPYPFLKKKIYTY